jgi:hypothetical protein
LAQRNSQTQKRHGRKIRKDENQNLFILLVCALRGYLFYKFNYKIVQPYKVQLIQNQATSEVQNTPITQTAKKIFPTQNPLH